MVVHFIASEYDILQDIEVLRKIVKVLHEHGYYLARDWIEPAYARRSKSKSLEGDGWLGIYQESMEAVAKADVVIAEVSHESFSVGYQVASAIQQKKPVLLLRKKGESDDVFVTGLASSIIVHKDYEDEGDLEGTLVKFLEDNRIENKDLRFNFFIDRAIYNYLRWASVRTGKTKAEILRELVEREIERGQS